METNNRCKIVMEDNYVSFETAKLLIEKGFDGKCARVWVEEKSNEPIRMGMSSFVEGEEVADKETVEAATGYANEYMFKNPCVAYLCPTLQMAMKWLREAHTDFCEIGYDDLGYNWIIVDLSDDCDNQPSYLSKSYGGYSTYEDACIAAIRYCLERLIP